MSAGDDKRTHTRDSDQSPLCPLHATLLGANISDSYTKAPVHNSIWKLLRCVPTEESKKSWIHLSEIATSECIISGWQSSQINLSHLVRYQVLTAAGMMFRIVFWDILPCTMIVDHHFTRQYIPEDNSGHLSHLRCNCVLLSSVGGLDIELTRVRLLERFKICRIMSTHCFV
jgi:hypothetical protein